MAPPEARVPATFRVGAYVGSVGGSGRLTVAPGQLGFVPDSLTRRLGAPRVEHEGCRVKLVWARWSPPWFNVSIQLRGTQKSCLVMLPQPSRRRLRDALQATGFDVEEVTTRVSRSRWS